MTPTSKSSKARDIGDVSNLGHAQFASAYRRYLPERAAKFNANFIFMTHQQEKINMNAIPGMPPTPQYKNDTSRGGRGLKSLASYVMTITPAGQITDSARNQIGQRACFALTKNSYGPPFRRSYASIYWAGKQDTDTTHADWFTFADETARWMADEKILGTTVRNNLYTCCALECVAVSAEKLHEALMKNHEVRESLMSRLGVSGYAIRPQTQVLGPISAGGDAACSTEDAGESEEENDEDGIQEDSEE
jgi:RecA/RadA recombinase